MTTSRRIDRWTLVAVVSACTIMGPVGCRTSLQRNEFSGLTPPNQPLVAPPPQGVAGKIKEAAAKTSRAAGLTVLGALCLGLFFWTGYDSEDGFTFD
ncbi:hypothetical protein [Candidatus Laterigemmans baculatus]|uniref:hypothetical protein n=1 Tax=Candidatus Laterigemmans baculatus TaxID=2770505 RepID=UPI0013D91CBB|nr:hypothetical protein [Candidatus Laterigemmans baculatus]